jgi:hypothetical protein
VNAERGTRRAPAPAPPGSDLRGQILLLDATDTWALSHDEQASIQVERVVAADDPEYVLVEGAWCGPEGHEDYARVEVRAGSLAGGSTVKSELVARVLLLPSRWVQLPGTTWEVYLHGKPYGSGSDGVEVARDHARTEFGGWNLTQVWQHIYVRHAR